MTGKATGGPRPPAKSEAAARAERSAAALRANLGRRKAQAQERAKEQVGEKAGGADAVQPSDTAVDPRTRD